MTYPIGPSPISPKINTSPSANDTFAGAGIDLQKLMQSPGGASLSGQLSPNSPIYFGHSKGQATIKGKKNAQPGPYAPGYATPFSGGYKLTSDTSQPAGDINKSYADAQQMPLSWDQATLSKFVNTGILYKIKGFGPDMGMPEIMSAWDDQLQAAHAFSQGSGKKWSPWDVMNSYNSKPGQFGEIKQGDWMVDAATGAKVKYVGPRSTTQTNKRIDLSSAEDVQAITTNALTQLLGRAPSDKEVAQYKATLNGYEREHPQVTTTTQQIDAQGVAGDTSTTSSGGVTDAARQALITDKTVGTPEYNKYQAGTTYFNALLQMIGGG